MDAKFPDHDATANLQALQKRQGSFMTHIPFFRA